MNDKVAILYAKIDEHAGKDDLDVFDEVSIVRESLVALGYKPIEVPVTLDLHELASVLRSLDPLVVFNLVESIEGFDSLIHIVPSFLGSLGIKYTGCSAESILLSTNKITAKNVFKVLNIPTPDWFVPNACSRRDFSFPPPYILKSIWEHASKNLSDKSVIFEKSAFDEVAAEFKPGCMFAEAFIDGREFNFALLSPPATGDDIDKEKGMEKPQILPVQEILFKDFPKGKPKIVGYTAKWDEESFEYVNTPRTFAISDPESASIDAMREISVKCWHSLGLSGYARCDFRVDSKGRPWLLEVNTNPCISHDSGFIAAAKHSGLDATTVVKRIVDAALSGGGKSINFNYSDEHGR
jgi:D-alanine-D-alanine ligase